MVRATRFAEVYPTASAISGLNVVSAEPVSSTSWTIAWPVSPAMVASTVIRSPSNSNELSDLIGHHDLRKARNGGGDLAGEEVGDRGIPLPPLCDSCE